MLTRVSVGVVTVRNSVAMSSKTEDTDTQRWPSQPTLLTHLQDSCPDVEVFHSRIHESTVDSPEKVETTKYPSVRDWTAK